MFVSLTQLLTSIELHVTKGSLVGLINCIRYMLIHAQVAFSMRGANSFIFKIKFKVGT
jgi:hypothetical protein